MPEPTPPTKPTPTDTSSPFQWFREIITAGISVAILVLAAITLYGTWDFARRPVDGKALDGKALDEKALATHKEAYERQKDIMLYALALLGTVTGYYLGRVPAELHAQKAQQAANAAQLQLQSAQSKLTDTAGSAAAAATQLSAANTDKERAQQKAQAARNVLEEVSKALGENLPDRRAVRREDVPESVTHIATVKERVDKLLREMQS